jgi:DNA-binding HxlR family transcriptional regulator
MVKESNERKCSKQGLCLCSARGIIEVVSKKWSICIVSILESGRPMRYSELKRRLHEISPKSLSDTLKILEKEGIVVRKMYPEIPPRVEYSLSEEGYDLKEVLMPLVAWVGERNDNSLLSG